MIIKDLLEPLIEKKAENVVILDIRKYQTFTDYFIIASGTSTKHVQALADAVTEENKKKKHPLIGEEGYRDGKWILLDYGEVVIHIFLDEVREFYDIESLWFEAKKIYPENILNNEN